jgi:iron(III) transport system ATP-binding protein
LSTVGTVSMAACAIELRQVSKRFNVQSPELAPLDKAAALIDKAAALLNINLQIPRGRLTTLLGPSGCGKSTLLRLMAGLERPTSGDILMNGAVVTHLGIEARNVSLVFQNYALFPHLNVRGNVAYGLKMLGLPEVAEQQRADAALALVGLQGLEARAVAELSGGQQQRLALARALAIEPSVLLLDEPLSNLDTRLRRHMREEIRSLQQRLQLTVVYVTHDQAEAMAVSDQVVVMHQAQVLQVGTPRETYLRPVDERVAAVMGDAAVVDATVVSSSVHGRGRVSLAALHIDVDGLPAQAQAGDVVRLVIRPEAWRIAAASGAGLPGKVLRRAYLGRSAEYLIEVPWGELWVSALNGDGSHPNGISLLQIGAPISLSLGRLGVSVLAASRQNFPVTQSPDDVDRRLIAFTPNPSPSRARVASNQSTESTAF